MNQLNRRRTSKIGFGSSGKRYLEGTTFEGIQVNRLVG